MSVHRLHVHRWKRVIDIPNVFLSKLSTIHQGHFVRVKIRLRVWVPQRAKHGSQNY